MRACARARAWVEAGSSAGDPTGASAFVLRSGGEWRGLLTTDYLLLGAAVVCG